MNAELTSGRGQRGVGSIRVRLAAAFAALILLLVAMASVGAWRLAHLDRVTREMATVNLRVERVVGDWLSLTRANAVRAVVLTQSDDPELRRLLTPAMEAASRRINDLQRDVEGLVDTPQGKALFQEVGARRSAYLDARRKVLDIRKDGDQQEGTRRMETTMLPAVDAYVASIQALAEYYTAEVARDAAAAQASASSGRNLLVVFCVGGLVVGLLAAVLITRSITVPLGEAVAAARRVADGDLTGRIESAARDETGQLLRALEAMRERLGTLVGEVAEGARSVADTSAQIAQGNVDLSQRTEEQASTLEETASSMEELTTTVTQNADHARRANELAAAACGVARDGGAAMRQVASTMEGISTASHQIAEIIGVIDGIAFQTNILALNAAVEAARAGEQGRGFAVVAAEVRTLAQRSAQAAREIKGLIARSTEQVAVGAREVTAATQKIEAIVESVQHVGALIADIATASQEQSSGIEQVNTAVIQMEHVVQQNASLVEEAAAATESMKAQAVALLQRVSRFRLQADHHLGSREAPAVFVAARIGDPAELAQRVGPALAA